MKDKLVWKDVYLWQEQQQHYQKLNVLQMQLHLSQYHIISSSNNSKSKIGMLQMKIHAATVSGMGYSIWGTLLCEGLETNVTHLTQENRLVVELGWGDKWDEFTEQKGTARDNAAVPLNAPNHQVSRTRINFQFEYDFLFTPADG